jgi:NAD(P)-dependent dehydrogenase (short-subunit alcohol dehydrogenase family)
MEELAGRVAVVTGAGQGIGRELVLRFGAEGMKLVVADIRDDLVEAVVGELTDAGYEAHGVTVDVTSLESVEQMRDATLERFGKVHVLCNNAGLGAGAQGALWEQHLNDWRWMFDVNVLGVVNGIHAFLPTMLAQDEEGHVLNTTSGNGGFTPLANSPIYAATKASVTTITECLWAQLKSQGAKVGASLLYPSTRTPGLLNTGIWRPGANRPERYDHPDAPPKEGRDALTMLEERMDAAGVELVWAPLEEVAELAVQAVRDGVFWATWPREEQAEKIRARAESQIARSDPDYLLEATPLTG